jgi:hypothetical protein
LWLCTKPDGLVTVGLAQPGQCDVWRELARFRRQAQRLADAFVHGLQPAQVGTFLDLHIKRVRLLRAEHAHAGERQLERRHGNDAA